MIYAEVRYGRMQLNASGELQNLEVLQLAPKVLQLVEGVKLRKVGSKRSDRFCNYLK